jgi:hypothetical protein
MPTPSVRLPMIGATLLALASVPAAVAATAPPDSTEPPSTSTASTPENCLPRDTLEDRTGVLGGTTSDGAEWVAAFGIDERGIQLVCVDLTLDGEEMTRGVLGGPFIAADETDEIVVDVLTAGVRGGPRWYVVRGTVTADAARIELSVDGGEPIEGQIAAAGPDDGWRWYAAAVPAPERTTFPDVAATAYDADDEPIAAGTSVFARTRD